MGMGPARRAGHNRMYPVRSPGHHLTPDAYTKSTNFGTNTLGYMGGSCGKDPWLVSDGTSPMQGGPLGLENGTIWDLELSLIHI